MGTFEQLTSKSEVMQRLLACAERVAMKDVTVLVRGETGTGKELIATLLHSSSGRAAAPFVKFNCAALPTDLAESLLFGHVKGAFTGAVTAHPGYFCEADGGTIFLDEVGELGASTQAALLRALQDGEIQPIGSTRTRSVDVRVIAATNRDLASEVRAGRFREDLYYRLAVVELMIPPLRDRRVDIPDLVEKFSARQARRFGIESVRFAPGTMTKLVEAPWPGNVRQLENVVTRLIATSSGGELDFDSTLGPAVARDLPELPTSTTPLAEQVCAFERSLVVSAYLAAGRNQSEAARRLAVCRSTLIDKLKKYGLC